MFLYYITDRSAFEGNGPQQCAALLRRIADAARAGVDYIQLREKDLPARKLEGLAREIVGAVRDNSDTAKLLINSRSDIALAVGADGVHLPTRELAPPDVRRLWMRCSGNKPLIGVSAHATEEVRCAESQGADFAVLAPIFEKVQAGIPGIGLEALRAACAGTQHESKETPGRFPVLALGGVTIANGADCIEAGAAGVAGIRLFQEGDVFEAVRRLRQL